MSFLQSQGWASKAAMAALLAAAMLPPESGLGLSESKPGIWGTVTDTDGQPLRGIVITVAAVTAADMAACLLEHPGQAAHPDAANPDKMQLHLRRKNHNNSAV